MRVGQGYDIHRIEREQSSEGIFICGVQVPCDYRVIAHSDGDVGLHALVDAIFGALGCGDIGEHFPDNDQRFAGYSSIKFLQHAYKLCVDRGFSIGNCDITIICQEPKVSPHKSRMKKVIAQALKIDETNINIKATTAEGLDAIGAKQGIAAHAICLLIADK